MWLEEQQAPAAFGNVSGGRWVWAGYDDQESLIAKVSDFTEFIEQKPDYLPGLRTAERKEENYQAVFTWKTEKIVLIMTEDLLQAYSPE